MNRRLALRCAACHEPEVYTARTDRLDIFAGVRGYKPALNRLMAWGHAYFERAFDEGGAACIGCGRWLTLQHGMPRDGPLPDCRGIHLRCAACSPPVDMSLHSIVLWSPEGRRFWRDHGRIRSMPQREIQADGRAAIVVGYESVTSGARFVVVFARDGYRILRRHGAAGG